jgi:uncharacterized protein YcfL
MAAMTFGCAKSVNQVDLSASNEFAWVQKDPTDPWLNNIARVQTARKAFEGDILRVQVVVMNTDHVANRFRYRYVWMDENGMEIDTPMTTWETIRIEGKQTKALNGTGPNARARDCRLELKRVDIGGF